MQQIYPSKQAVKNVSKVARNAKGKVSASLDYGFMES